MVGGFSDLLLKILEEVFFDKIAAIAEFRKTVVICSVRSEAKMTIIGSFLLFEELYY